MKPSNKESFLLYKSFYEPIKNMSKDELGELLKAIFEYHINPNNPIGFLGSNTKMAFEFFKNQFRLDDAKYQKVVERNRKNGLKGGRPRLNTQNPKNPVGIKKPKKPDNDNDNDIKKNIHLSEYDKRTKIYTILEAASASEGKP